MKLTTSVLKQSLIAALMLFTQAASASEIPAPLKSLFLNDLRLIPVQSGGRLKPFDEFARETILSLYGSRVYGSFDPSEMIISMMVNPQLWAETEIIRISSEDVRKQLLVEPARKYFTPTELMKNNAFLQYAEGIVSGGQTVSSTGVNPVTGGKDPRAEEMKRVVGRMTQFQALVGGKLWLVTPPADKNPETAWIPLSEGMVEATPQSTAVYQLLKTYLDGDVEAFKAQAAQTRRVIEDATPQFEGVAMKLKLETFYNRLRPFLQSMIFYLLAGLFWLFSAKHVFVRRLAKSFTVIAILLHVVGFALRCYIAGRPPVTNMYESIIWVSLGVIVFALILYARNKQIVLITTATILAGLALFAADSAPMVIDPTIRPLVAVLRSNYWLTIHVLTITISYGAFMLAMGIANVSLFQFYKKVKSTSSEQGMRISQRISTLNQMSYHALMFGTVLLAAGTILGGIWADYSWGRFWGWDPKEVWALIALLSYMAVLHGRYAGWVGTFAFPLWTVICFSTVVMAWYGVNFVLGVGLHSYGFSSGGQGVVALFLLLQAVFCVWIAFENRKLKASTTT